MIRRRVVNEGGNEEEKQKGKKQGEIGRCAPRAVAASVLATRTSKTGRTLNDIPCPFKFKRKEQNTYSTTTLPYF